MIKQLENPNGYRKIADYLKFDYPRYDTSRTTNPPVPGSSNGRN